MPEPKASLVGRDCPLGKTLEHPGDVRWKGLEGRIKTPSTQTHTHTHSQKQTQIIQGLVWHHCQGAVKGKDESLWHTETSHTHLGLHATHANTKRNGFPLFFLISVRSSTHLVACCYSSIPLAAASDKQSQLPSKPHNPSFCRKPPLSWWSVLLSSIASFVSTPSCEPTLIIYHWWNK